MNGEVEFGRRSWRTGLLVIQPTPFCNINCSYCYLPQRSNKKRMSLETAARIFERVLQYPSIEESIGIVWHAGEPMVLPASYYEEMFALIAKLAGPRIEVGHSFQTNGTLLSQDWCDLIRKWRVNVGLSIDGPAEFHDLNRKYRNGAGSFAAAERGLELLKKSDIPFYVISVLTIDSVRHPDRMFDYYEAAGIENVCFNIEEKEGINTSSAVVDGTQFAELYRAFLRRFYERAMQKKNSMVVREFESCLRAIHGFGHVIGNQQSAPLDIVSIDCDGNLSTFSPELLGMDHPTYGSFSFGNVLEDDFDTIAKRVEDSRLYADIRAGVRKCEDECAYYGVCGGGAPANKIYENNSADSTQTVYCRAHQIGIDVALELIERIPPDAGHLLQASRAVADGRAPPI
ncbi:MAG: GRRM system radical SAM/SPASM domain protein [Proteobacteria bacterium]|nr:GRRM system radical SAM/SPASM domain protein [Pseudomonadota bacterium]